MNLRNWKQQNLIKLMAVSASPVDGSSTDLILNDIIRQLTERLETNREVTSSFTKLSNLKFIPCKACGKAPSNEFCFYDDDLAPLYKELERCDCFLFGSPIYFDSVSAQGKAFIDRCNCFRPADFDNCDPDHDFIKRIDRKRPGAMVLVGGEEGWFEGARRTIAGFMKWIEVTNEGMITFRSSDFNRIGTSAGDITVKHEVNQLVDRLASRILELHADRK